MKDGRRPAPWMVLIILGTAISITAPQKSQAAVNPAKVVFNRDIRPILSDKCFACHGPDKNKRQAGLRLDEPNRVVITGKVSASELIHRIKLPENAGSHMPPASFHKKLTEPQKQLLARWIAEGGTYQKHWSYEFPVKEVIPSGLNPIDFLVRRQLSEHGLKPSPAADRRILIRRLCFDLLGLPPAPSEVTTYLNDHTPRAYINLVDQILDNPHYGERMAQGWLDVVRYADTIGYHSDTPRNIWPYRDWVIESFNRNKRFDRFTREQLAGDLLPDAQQEEHVGSAFNRLLLTTEEGGAQAKDYEARYLTDRVRAVGTVWLGQTTGCAQCHDHKFDPITTRDFYSMGAFFADVDEAIIGAREQGMLLSTPEQSTELERRKVQFLELNQRYDGPHPELAQARLSWEKSVQEKLPTSPALPADVKLALAVASEKRTSDQAEKLNNYYKSIAPEIADLRNQLARAQKDRDDYEVAIPHCLVTVKNAKPRTVRVLPRGNFLDENGPTMQPATPAFLPGNTGGTRLDLANWIVSRQNPLTARTVMNRLWKQFFGFGLCKILEDLGAQGEPPSNPALLDWLACEFMDSGWDIKHMVRIIVNSAAYKQVSTADKLLLTRDPNNRECARQSRFRLEAEEVRDNALAISGLLSYRIGGPSVKPYQPDNYWENLNFPVRDYKADKGENQYRRGMYTWWQRSFLHPSLLAFDAPSREECTAERNRSNIPQQALVLLNDPTYVEAARAFGVRILTHASNNPKLGLNWAWQQALQRMPTQAELSSLQNVYTKQLDSYRSDPGAADALLHVTDFQLPRNVDRNSLAAWTHVARVLLNLHETITRQ